MAKPGRPRKADTAETTNETMEGRVPRQRARSERGRKRRQPLGQSQQKLAATVPDGMVGHWFNDTPGRVQQAMDAGYTFISNEGEDLEEEGSRDQARRELVGRKEDGSPMYAYLMAIPAEWYQEDQAAKQSAVDETDSAIRRGNIRGAARGDESSYYVPSEGISVRND